MTARTRQRLGWAAVLATTVAAFGCRAGLDDYRRRLVLPQTGPGVRVTWLATAGVVVDDGETQLLIDPFVSRPRLGAVAFGRPLEVDHGAVSRAVSRYGVTNLGAVLVTHSHYDHLMDASAFVASAGGVLVGSPSTLTVGAAEGLRPAQMQPADPDTPIRLGRFTVTMVPSKHGKALAGKVPFPGTIDRGFQVPARARQYRMGGAYGVVIEHPDGVIVHHGSAAFVPGMYDGVQADVVLLGIAGRQDTLDYLRAVVDVLGAKRVIPIHFDNFFRPLRRGLRTLPGVDLDGFFVELAAWRPDLAVQTLPVGEPRRLLVPN